MNEFVSIDIGAIENFINHLDEVDPQIVTYLLYLGQKSLDIYDQIVKTETPVNTGMLRSSFKKRVEGNPEGIRGEIYTDLVYGWAVERGRAPGKMPPVAPLAFWFIRKGIVERDQALRAAWGLAMAIAAGTSRHQLKGGSKMVEIAFDRGTPLVEYLWKDATDKIVEILRG